AVRGARGRRLHRRVRRRAERGAGVGRGRGPGVLAFVWRALFGWVVLRLLRLAWRRTPTLAGGGVALAVGASGAVAWGVGRRGLPALAARRPGCAVWCGRALAGAGVLLLAALVLAGPEARAWVVLTYKVGWVAPLAVPVGVSPRLALLAALVASPLWLAGGVVLAGLWPLYGGPVRR